jgi:hypothetical protein
MMREVRNFTALVLMIVMVFMCMGTNVFAAEQSCFPENNRTDVVDSSVLVPDDDGTITLDLSNIDFTEISETDSVELEPEEPPQDSVVYLLNKTDVVSSDVDDKFAAATTCRITLVLCCKYVDGSTGDLKGSFANYSGTVHVDGVSRLIAQDIAIYAGAQHFKITGVTKPMAYTVIIYMS